MENTLEGILFPVQLRDAEDNRTFCTLYAPWLSCMVLLQLKAQASSAAAGREGRRGGGHGSVGRHQAFEFFKPVLDDVDFRSCPLILHHEELSFQGVAVLPILLPT